MSAERRQGSVAVDFVIVTVGINGLALVQLAMTSPGDLNSFRRRPEKLIWREFAGKNFVRQRAVEAGVEVLLRQW